MTLRVHLRAVVPDLSLLGCSGDIASIAGSSIANLVLVI